MALTQTRIAHSATALGAVEYLIRKVKGLTGEFHAPAPMDGWSIEWGPETELAQGGNPHCGTEWCEEYETGQTEVRLIFQGTLPSEVERSIESRLRALECAGLDFQQYETHFAATWLRGYEQQNLEAEQPVLDCFSDELPPIQGADAFDPFAED